MCFESRTKYEALLDVNANMQPSTMLLMPITVTDNTEILVVLANKATNPLSKLHAKIISDDRSAQFMTPNV